MLLNASSLKTQETEEKMPLVMGILSQNPTMSLYENLIHCPYLWHPRFRQISTEVSDTQESFVRLCDF